MADKQKPPLKGKRGEQKPFAAFRNREDATASSRKSDRPASDRPRAIAKKNESDKTKLWKNRDDQKERRSERNRDDTQSRGSLSPSGGRGRVRGENGKAEVDKTLTSSDGGMRLNKYLAHCGIASRRAADTLILQGQVKVNNVIIQEMGYKVQPNDIVIFKGKTIKPVEKHVYYLLNKPRNVLTTSSDERGRKTVLDILAAKVPERVYPVGRLDRNTSGLILLTNDGELTRKLSHPSHKVPKVYHVTLDKNLALKDMEAIRHGITLEDGLIKADSLHFVEEMSKRDVAIELHSGKNRIVRRIFESLGYEVVKLDRTYYAGLTKKNLPRGFFRPLTKEEVRMLKHFT
jgi:23S rRNA pseudouridine2605 synthase